MEYVRQKRAVESGTQVSNCVILDEKEKGINNKLLLGAFLNK